jgi:hypothetical protein
MKSKLVLLFSAVLLVSACSGPEAAPPATSATSTPNVVVAVAPTPFYSPRPDDTVHFDFPFQLASDRYYATDKGETRRRLVLEFLGGNATEVWGKIELAMGEAGYKLQNQGEAGTGKGTFSKKGKRSIFVDTTGKRPADPAHPDAVGTVWISWSVTDVAVPPKSASAGDAAVGAPATQG